LEWGKQMLCAHIRLGMQFSSQRELHGESSQTSSEVKPTVQTQDDFSHLIP
jgi:hypothetical protein